MLRPTQHLWGMEHAPPSSMLLNLRRLWRWCDKWLVHVWLGIPLAAGLVGWSGGGLDRYQDIGKYALYAPRIERRGLIKSVDPRKREQVLIDGNSHYPVKCGLPDNNYCLKYIAPLIVSVRMFKYRGYYVIVDMTDESGNRLISEDNRVKSIVDAASSYAENTAADSAVFMVLASSVLVLPLIIGIPMIRAYGRRKVEKSR